jgi:hypothetical protein
MSDLLSAASGPPGVSDWIASIGWGPIAVVAAALISLIALLINGSRQRAYEAKMARRNRLAPKLRDLIQICQELQGVASRLTHDPAHEVQASPAALRDLQQRLDGILEPDLADSHNDLQQVHSSVVQWRGMQLIALDDRGQGHHVNPRMGDRIDEIEDQVAGELTRIKKELEAALKKLEG